jgi:branched-chain amino acid transport system substrate-binding protein
LARGGWAARSASAALLLALTLGACGDSGGVSPGATVSVYLSAPMRGTEGKLGRTLCAEANHTLSRAGGEVGDLHVRLLCLDASGPSGAWTLAQVGANARKAVEDSTTVAYIGEPSSKARLQSQPILESAGIADVHASSGAAAMNRVLRAIESADRGDSLRESVSESLEGS